METASKLYNQFGNNGNWIKFVECSGKLFTIVNILFSLTCEMSEPKIVLGDSEIITATAITNASSKQNDGSDRAIRPRYRASAYF